MSDYIELFMWGFQAHFRSAVELTVERALEELGHPVEPEVFLVGFLQEGGTRHPICIEPEEGLLTPADFESTVYQAERIFQADPESEIWHSDRRVHEARQAAIRDRAWRTAIAEVLQSKVGGRFFVAPSVPVEQHRVFAAIGLPMTAVEAFPALARDRTDDERTVLDRSLLEAATGPLLGHISRALYQPDPGSRFGELVDPAEVARAAGDSLALDTAYRADSSKPAHGLFDALNRLATATYEKRAGLGRLVIASPAAAGVDRMLLLDQPVPMKEIRSIRKLLETSRNDGAALLTNGSVAYGLGDINDSYDPSSESVFEVLVTGPGSWDLSHARQSLMRVTYGSPRLAEPRLSQAQFENLATRLFGPVGGCDVDRLWALAMEASQAEHGTMLVVSAQAADEASRLQAQALVVQPAPLTAELVQQVTSIDGAVLVDPQAFSSPSASSSMARPHPREIVRVARASTPPCGTSLPPQREQ
jgi:hypothetical protein